MPTRFSVVGSRGFTRQSLVRQILSLLINTEHGDTDEIVSGGAQGVDTWAEHWANDHAVPIRIYKPDWKRYGKSAGFKRNHNIIKDSTTTIAFWDGKSKGTEHSIGLAQAQGNTLIIIQVEE